MAETVRHILVVDDQIDFARGIARLLEGQYDGITVHTAGGGREALAHLDDHHTDIMLTDLRMPGMDGQTLLENALERHPQLCAVMLTAYGSIETAVSALKTGAYDFVTKPVEPEELFRVVHRGLERARLVEENTRLRGLLAKRPDSMVGESPAMHRLREQVSAVARTDYTVLVLGESGTGKELVARSVHDISQRAEKPFIAVNCPAIPENLLESELFGHVKGAFTGADKRREGLFAEADGGTLLLDEIGDIPMETQTKLLRVLQEGEVRPVGSDASRAVDVRVIASTNVDLAARIADKTFREDLYYRLNVLTVGVPPLREREGDIPMLARYFLHKSCRELGLSRHGKKDGGCENCTRTITGEVLDWLMAQSWAGNVRELQNAMRKLAVFSAGQSVTMTTVRLAGLAEGSGEGTSTDGGFGVGEAMVPLAAPDAGGNDGVVPYKDAKQRVVDGFTLEYVKRLLTLTRGNVSKAARLAGLSRVALQNILSRFEIEAAGFK